MKWLVAALYSFSAIVMFISITFIYNLNKKKVAQMTEELTARRAAEAAAAPAEEVAELKEDNSLAEDVADTAKKE